MQEEAEPEHIAVCEPGQGDSIVSSVISTVAAVDGIEPTTLPPLQWTLDTDALEALLDSDDTPLSVVFEYSGYLITVDSDGLIQIRESAEAG